jgi:uncharacterized repeat protein (TIGR01451 family)
MFVDRFLYPCACFALSVAAGLALPQSSIATENPDDPDEKSYVFLDPAIKQRQLLTFTDIRDQHIILLQKDVPLLEQIARQLKGKKGIKAIHVITEGAAGKVQTSAGALTLESLSELDSFTQATIAEALSPGADLLIYGCGIAGTDEGKLFVKKLGDSLGLDVAASTNDTGHSSLGADWNLEYKVGEVTTQAAVSANSQTDWTETLAIGITVAGNTTTLMNALGPTGQNGVTYTGTPTILGAFGSNAYGTFTTTGSNLGMSSGAVFGTGNITQISGAPSFFWDGAGTGSNSGVEFDRAALTFNFTPNAGVTKVAFRYIMGSEEYNEYVGQGFSDNMTIRLNGGAYSNQNVAVVPGTSTGIDIDTINASLNSTYYRDNTIASPPVPDSVLDGHTTLLQSITTVVPATSYSAEIKVVDYTDNRWNSALFVDYFGSSLLLDLDSNNSSGAALANYQTTFTEGGASVAVVDTDRTITNFDTTSIQSATITLTNAFASDSLTFTGLPAGITGTTDTSVPGVIKVTFTGASTIADYQTALSTLRFSNSSNVPNTTARNITVVVNDGATNSNTATSTITVVSVPTYLYTVSKTASAATISTPGNINYTITLTNTGDGNMTGMTVSDVLTQGASNTGLTLSGPSGDGGTVGQFGIGETWTYTATFAATQTHIDNGNDLVNTVSVSSTQTAPAVQTAQATTVVTKSPSFTISKAANTAGPVNAGQVITYTYTVRNTGNISINNVGISDVHNGTGTLPVPGTETLTIDVSPTGDSTDTAINGTWNKLAPGDTIRFTSTYSVTQSDIDTLQ